MCRRFPWSFLFLLLLAVPAGAADATLTLDLGGGVKMELVLVKKGSFTQGSPKTKPGRSEDETERKVTLTHDFYLGKFPVTRGQFARFVKDAGYRTEAERGTSGGFGWDGKKLVQKKEYTWRNPGFEQTDEHPVVIVTHDDARAFCAFLTKKAGREVTLPTEAQWEYACRAGTTTAYSNGDAADKVGDIAWYLANAGNGTHPVGKKQANAWGLHDMSGNVFEWCRDWYGPYKVGPVEDPEEKNDKLSDPPRRVLRGGSWLREAKFCRSAARYRSTPGSRNADNGFRVLASAGSKPEGQEQGLGGPVAGPPFATAPLLAILDCLIVGVVLIIAVIVFVVKNLASQPGPWRGGRAGTAGGTPPMPPWERDVAPTLNPEDVGLREAADGFWVQLSGVEPGSEVRYRFRMDDQDQTGSITYEPGPQGMFIYTGGRPTEIQVTSIIHPRGQSLLPPLWVPRRPAPPPPPRPIRAQMLPPVVPPPRHYPPAY